MTIILYAKGPSRHGESSKVMHGINVLKKWGITLQDDNFRLHLQNPLTLT